MINKDALCEKIRSIYPDIGACGIDIRAEYDKKEKSWVVFLKRGRSEIKHFLPGEDADACMDGKQCVGLGLEIAQFRDHDNA